MQASHGMGPLLNTTFTRNIISEEVTSSEQFTSPEITQMQVRAIITAATDIQKNHKKPMVFPDIMIPLIGGVKEFVH